MENFTFYKPSTGYPMDDFQQSIMELLLSVHDDVGGMSAAASDLQCIIRKAAPVLTEHEAVTLIKIQSAVGCISHLIAEDENTFRLFQLEQTEYKEDYV